MMWMAQGSREGADTAKAHDDSSMVHTHHVHSVCTSVNVECVQPRRDNDGVTDQTAGQRIRALMDRAGFTVRTFATAAGYKHGSGVQRFIDADFDSALSGPVAKRLASALAGRGEPPIDASEIYALVDMPTQNAVPLKYEGASEARMREDLPILGTALGADRVSDGLAIEQTYLYEHDIIGYARRPVILDGRVDAYGIYVQGSSMDPVFEDGALILVETKRPPRVGDNVVVYLRKNGGDQDGDDGNSARTVLVKRLVRRSGSFIELEQHNPKMTFTIDQADVLQTHRVMTLADLLA